MKKIIYTKKEKNLIKYIEKNLRSVSNLSKEIAKYREIFKINLAKRT
jgi:hypothetical protein